MKNLIIILISIISFTSCKKEKFFSDAPDEMVGQWLYGTFSMTEYWNYDGSYEGNAFEMSVAFDFNDNGEYEMYFIAVANNYGCRTEAFTYTKGTVDWDTPGQFTLTPDEGNYRGFYNCTPQYNFDRDAEKSELQTQTFYYTFEADDYGKEYLVIRFDPSDEYPTYFSPTSW
ncbi:MAG: hypothetical protein H7Y00_02015 [Fimbriimonadaceae bacterium]|nr:hypothetical protein [Chitinophagales bacterium]